MANLTPLLIQHSFLIPMSRIMSFTVLAVSQIRRSWCRISYRAEARKSSIAIVSIELTSQQIKLMAGHQAIYIYNSMLRAHFYYRVAKSLYYDWFNCIDKVAGADVAKAPPLTEFFILPHCRHLRHDLDILCSLWPWLHVYNCLGVAPTTKGTWESGWSRSFYVLEPYK